ncbi:MAG: hypothetical protein LQ346_005159, partial [Caloplaca aetnensis]
RLVDDLRATQREINRTAEYIMSDIYAPPSPPFSAPLPQPITRPAAAPPRKISPDDVLYEEVQGLLKTCITLFYEADDLLKRSERDPYGFRRRVLFLLNREVVAEKMARLEGQKAKLGEIRMGLFLRRSARQDEALRRIADSLSRTSSGALFGDEVGELKDRRKLEDGQREEWRRCRNTAPEICRFEYDEQSMGWKSSLL